MSRDSTDSVQKVLETKWFSIETVPWESPSGEPYYRLTCDDSVGILALTVEQEIILVRQFRPAIGETVIELPSGQIDENESPEQAVVRELQEETGYVCDSISYLGAYRSCASRINNHVHLFFGKGARYIQSKEGQDTEVVLATKDEFIRLITDGECAQIGGLAAFLLCQLKGEI